MCSIHLDMGIYMGGCLYSCRRATNNREPWTKIFAIVGGAGEGAHIRNSGNKYD